MVQNQKSVATHTRDDAHFGPRPAPDGTLATGPLSTNTGILPTISGSSPPEACYYHNGEPYSMLPQTPLPSSSSGANRRQLARNFPTTAFGSSSPETLCSSDHDSNSDDNNDVASIFGGVSVQKQQQQKHATTRKTTISNPAAASAYGHSGNSINQLEFSGAAAAVNLDQTSTLTSHNFESLFSRNIQTPARYTCSDSLPNESIRESTRAMPPPKFPHLRAKLLRLSATPSTADFVDTNSILCPHPLPPLPTPQHVVGDMTQLLFSQRLKPSSTPFSHGTSVNGVYSNNQSSFAAADPSLTFTEANLLGSAFTENPGAENLALHVPATTNNDYNAGTIPRSRSETFAAPLLSSSFPQASGSFSDHVEKERIGDKTYHILNKIGSGGSSTVFSAYDPSEAGKIVAIKKVRLLGEITGQIREEASTLLHLVSDGCRSVVQLYKYQEQNGYAFFVMELGSLDIHQLMTDFRTTMQNDRILKSRKNSSSFSTTLTTASTILDIAGHHGPSPIDAMTPIEAAELLNFVRHYFSQMVKCVQDIHDRRVIHADLKPANFLVVDGHVKLIDFGISQQMSNDTTSVSFTQMQGTLNYMAPERLALGYSTNNTSAFATSGTSARGGGAGGSGGGGEISGARLNRKLEVWALGCILYYMVYGHPPFPNPTPQIKIMHICNSTYEITYKELPGVAMDAVIDAMRQCLRRNPEERVDLADLRTHRFLYPDLSP